MDECPVDGCKDMTTAKIWNRVFRWGASLGIFLYLLVGVADHLENKESNEASLKIQAEAKELQAETLKAIGELTDEFHDFQRSIMRQIRLMEYDGQRERSNLNKLNKINGLDPIELRPFRPPTYEDMLSTNQ